MPTASVTRTNAQQALDMTIVNRQRLSEIYNRQSRFQSPSVSLTKNYGFVPTRNVSSAGIRTPAPRTQTQAQIRAQILQTSLNESLINRSQYGNGTQVNTPKPSAAVGAMGGIATPLAALGEGVLKQQVIANHDAQRLLEQQLLDAGLKDEDTIFLRDINTGLFGRAEFSDYGKNRLEEARLKRYIDQQQAKPEIRRKLYENATKSQSSSSSSAAAAGSNAPGRPNPNPNQPKPNPTANLPTNHPSNPAGPSPSSPGTPGGYVPVYQPNYPAFAPINPGSENPANDLRPPTPADFLIPADPSNPGKALPPPGGYPPGGNLPVGFVPVPPSPTVPLPGSVINKSYRLNDFDYGGTQTNKFTGNNQDQAQTITTQSSGIPQVRTVTGKASITVERTAAPEPKYDNQTGALLGFNQFEIVRLVVSWAQGTDNPQRTIIYEATFDAGSFTHSLTITPTDPTDPDPIIPGQPAPPTPVPVDPQTGNPALPAMPPIPSQLEPTSPALTPHPSPQRSPTGNPQQVPNPQATPILNPGQPAPQPRFAPIPQPVNPVQPKSPANPLNTPNLPWNNPFTKPFTENPAPTITQPYSAPGGGLKLQRPPEATPTDTYGFNPDPLNSPSPLNAPNPYANPSNDIQKLKTPQNITDPSGNVDAPKVQEREQLKTAPKPEDIPQPRKTCDDPCVQGLHEKIDKQENEFEIIQFNIFNSCNEAGEPVYTTNSLPVPRIAAAILQTALNNIAESQGQQCKLPEDECECYAAIPDWWQIRLGADIPQAVVQYAEMKPGGKFGSPKYSVSIPHYGKSKEATQESDFPTYIKGQKMGILTLRDNSKLIVNAKDSSEIERVINQLQKMIAPAWLQGAIYSDGQRKGTALQMIRVAPRIVKYFPNGQTEPKPKWIKYF